MSLYRTRNQFRTGKRVVLEARTIGKGSVLARIYAAYKVLLACITPCWQIGR